VDEVIEEVVICVHCTTLEGSVGELAYSWDYYYINFSPRSYPVKEVQYSIFYVLPEGFK